MTTDKTEKFFKDMEDPHKQAEYILFIEEEEALYKARKEEQLLEDEED